MLVTAALRIIAGVGTNGDKLDLLNDRVDNADWHPDWRHNTEDKEQVLYAAIAYIAERIK